MTASDSSVFFLGDFKSLGKGETPALFPLSALGCADEPGLAVEPSGKAADGESLGRQLGTCSNCTWPIYEADIRDGYAETCDGSRTGFVCSQAALSVAECRKHAKKVKEKMKEDALYRAALLDVSYMRASRPSTPRRSLNCALSTDACITTCVAQGTTTHVRTRPFLHCQAAANPRRPQPMRLLCVPSSTSGLGQKRGLPTVLQTLRAALLPGFTVQLASSLPSNPADARWPLTLPTACWRSRR